MRNHFTITISDVHGSRHYSFKQFVRKFALMLVLFVFLMFAAAAVTIWWLNQEIVDIEHKRFQAQNEYQQVLASHEQAYQALQTEKQRLQNQLDDKSQQVQFLDQTLQGIEDLIGVQPGEASVVTERVKVAQLTTIEKQFLLEALPNGRPVKNFKGVSSSFGWRTHPVKGSREFHSGIDYRGGSDDPVIATAEGVVEYAGYHKSSGFGNLVILSHAHGFKTLYGHMSQLSVKTGQVVHQGQTLGMIGSTGLSSGPHLHYEISFVQRKLNPTAFVHWDLTHYNEVFKEVEGVPWGSLSQITQNRVQRVEKQLSLRDVN